MEEDKNYINLIRGDLTKASQAHNGMPDSVGMMNIKTANQTILEASLLPTPRALWVNRLIFGIIIPVHNY